MAVPRGWKTACWLEEICGPCRRSETLQYWGRVEGRDLQVNRCSWGPLLWWEDQVISLLWADTVLPQHGLSAVAEGLGRCASLEAVVPPEMPREIL